MGNQHSEAVAVSAETLSGPLDAWGPRAGADRGNPEISGRRLHEAEGEFKTAIWQCTPGSWVSEARPDSESVVILEGRARLTSSQGVVTEVKAGDVLIVPKGWAGRWEILETLRKVAVLIP